MRQEEHKQQCAFFLYVRGKAQERTPTAWLYDAIAAIPNAGKHKVQFRVKQKNEGLSAGFPDIAILIPTKNYHGLFIEFKDKTALSDEQVTWKARLEKLGYAYFVARTDNKAPAAKYAVDFLEEYLLDL